MIPPPTGGDGPDLERVRAALEKAKWRREKAAEIQKQWKEETGKILSIPTPPDEKNKKAAQDKADKIQKEAETAKHQASELAKKAADAEAAKRKAEAEKKRKAEAERKRKESEMRKQMEAKARAARASQAMSKYVPRIQQKVQDNWTYPPRGPEGCNPTVRVNLAPGGKVLSAKIVKSSGDRYCDNSVEKAFLKASTLPIPLDPDLYSEFKNIDFPFRP